MKRQTVVVMHGTCGGEVFDKYVWGAATVGAIGIIEEQSGGTYAVELGIQARASGRSRWWYTSVDFTRLGRL